MSEPQPEITGDGVYHPEAAQYQPYNEAMAAWRNQVAAMNPASAQAPVAPEEEPQESEAEEEAPEAPETPEEAPEAAETPQEEVEGDKPFDPSEHNAPAVLDYLRTVGYEEALRVLDAEEAGKARKGVTNARQDILDQAKANDQKSNESE